MKKLFSQIKASLPMLIATIAVGAATLFSTMPCNGPYYEPEMPEELVK